jgi:hypothetical protein
MSAAEKCAPTSSSDTTLQRKKAAFFQRKGADNMLQLDNLLLVRDLRTPSTEDLSIWNGSSGTASSGKSWKGDEDAQHEPETHSKVWSDFLEFQMPC